VPYYREYRGFEVHLEDSTEYDQLPFVWRVVGFGGERSFGAAPSRHEAYFAARASIDHIQSDPFRFPINLLGYPDQSGGEVVTRDGEVLGHWRLSGDESLKLVEFIPLGASEALFRDHFIGLLCESISDWHEGKVS